MNFLIKNFVRRPNYRMRMITLSVRNMPSLTGQIRYLIRSFRKLRSRSFWRRHVDGGAMVVEITGRPNNWHAHLHIVAHSAYLDWKVLLKDWQSVSSGSAVWIDAIPDTKATHYVTKYLSKPECPEMVLSEMSDSMKGIRLFTPFGSWHSINKLYKKPDPVCIFCKSSATVVDGFPSIFSIDDIGILLPDALERASPELDKDFC